MQWEVIVLGVGAMGAAACHRLAKAGARVLGLEQFHAAHDRGSSHGVTRMIRRAYFEHPDYVPLLERAEAGWEDLQRACGQSIYRRNGLLLFGDGKSPILTGVRESARRYAIPVEELDAAACGRRFPYYGAPPDHGAIFEPGAGYLRVEKCVAAFWTQARNAGAELREHCPVTGWHAEKSGVEVEAGGDRFRAKSLVITAGAWSARLLSDLGLDLSVHRNFLFWFSPPSLSAPDDSRPCFGYDLPSGFVYGFPPDEHGLKAALHAPGPRLDRPEKKEAPPSESDLAPVRDVATRFLGSKGSVVRHETCLYTMSPDGHFIVDRHPGHPNVVFAAGFSGHGFKFAPVIGEALRDLALKGKSDLPIGFLRRR